MWISVGTGDCVVRLSETTWFVGVGDRKIVSRDVDESRLRIDPDGEGKGGLEFVDPVIDPVNDPVDETLFSLDIREFRNSLSGIEIVRASLSLTRSFSSS